MWRLIRGLIGAIVALAIIVVAWLLLGVKHVPAYPPSPDALPPAAARGLVERLAVEERVSTADLAVALAPSTASSFQLEIDGPRFFPRILDDIRGARTSVHIAEYGVKPGELADELVPILQDKARQGIPVRMVVDRLGSAVDFASKGMFDQLVGAGVQVVRNDAALIDRDGLLGGDRWIDWRFDELGRIDHRKLFVIDGRIGWVGGAGIEDHFLNGSFHDVMVRVEGEAVWQLQSVFMSSFRLLGGPLPTAPADIDPYFPAPAAGTIRTSVAHNVGREGHLANTDVIHHLIDTAQQRLDLVSPASADHIVFEKMMAASRRGVKVRFVVPAASNNLLTAYALEHYFAQFQEAGVEVWLHPILPHCKVVLADDRVLVGTTNLDAWALYRNWEIGLFFEDAGVAETFRTDLFDVDIARSRPAVPPTDPLVRLRNWLFSVASPWL
jgi:cardiolipin synthase A/B